VSDIGAASPKPLGVADTALRRPRVDNEMQELELL
jgi:hypothetical protein